MVELDSVPVVLVVILVVETKVFVQIVVFVVAVVFNASRGVTMKVVVVVVGDLIVVDPNVVFYCFCRGYHKSRCCCC